MTTRQTLTLDVNDDGLRRGDNSETPYVYLPSGGPLRLSQVRLVETTAPSPVADSGFLYAVDASGVTHLRYMDSAGTVHTLSPPAGGAGSGAAGITTINFGSFPGASDASVTVTGQTSIASGSVVQAWLNPAATSDHSADEHLLETILVYAGNIVAGTGFTIYAINSSQISEPGSGITQLLGRASINQGGGRRDGQVYTASGTRVYGQWSVAWRWS